MFDKILFFKGKLKHEQFICEQPIDELTVLPQKKELVALPKPDENDVMASDVYVVKQVLIDYACHEYNVFVELYDWED